MKKSIASDLVLKALLLGVCLLAQTQPSAYAQIPHPTLFEPGRINTGEYESHPAFSPGGETLYFLKCTPDINNSCTICISFLKNGKWTDPIVAPFSGQYMDIDPFVTADGKTLYFVSDRPLKKDGASKKDSDIWRVSIGSAGWGEPEHVKGPVNSVADEYYPTLSDNGNLYFGSTRNGQRGSDIFRSRFVQGNFLEPESLSDSVNTANHEYEPFISFDESFLIFMATIPNGLGYADFYVSYNRQGQWSKAQKLPEPINSAYTEWSPKITRDKKYFFFSSTRSIPAGKKSTTLKELRENLNRIGNGLGDIYFLDVEFLTTQKH